MRCEHRAPLLALLALLAVGCKKDGDAEPPRITISAPASGEVVTVPDTLVVEATVTDNTRIEQVTFSVLDGQGMPVTPSFTVEPGGTSANLVVELPITSDLVLSGTHEVKVVASDGEGRGTASRLIEVNGRPRRTRAIHIVGSTGFSPVQVYRIDSTGQLSPGPLVTLNHDIAPAAISSKARRLYVGGGITGPLTALFPDDGSITAEVPSQNILPIPFHTALAVGGSGMLFAASNDGALRRYGTDLNGTGYSAQALSEHRISGILELDNAVVTTQSRYVGPVGHRVVRYSSTAGVEQGAWPLDQTPVALHPRDQDHVLLFGNRNGQGVIEDRDIVDGGAWEPRTFTSPILAVARIDANTYLVSLAGSLQRFNYANATALTLATGTAYEVLAFDEVNGVLIGAESGQVSFIDPATGNVTGGLTAPIAVTALLPLYSR
ncbi:MAG: hypothetical protein JNL05_12085 [Flavobacteriales bacterium]|nr:hypothetical protein [Flavobacteriales bacterium]